MISPATSRTGIKGVGALTLAFAAGCVDFMGYMNFAHEFTAHLTGTTVHLGQRLMLAPWPEAALAAGVIISFLAGSIVGRTAIEVGSRRRVRSLAVILLAA